MPLPGLKTNYVFPAKFKRKVILSIFIADHVIFYRKIFRLKIICLPIIIKACVRIVV